MPIIALQLQRHHTKLKFVACRLSSSGRILLDMRSDLEENTVYAGTLIAPSYLGV